MKTTDQVGVTASESVEAHVPSPGIRTTARSPRHIGWLVGSVAVAWLVAGLAVLVHVGWLLLPLFVIAVSAVLRTGRNLLDRVMLGVVVAAAALVTGGLLFSLWPWGLAPFPVAGSLFTAVAVAAWLGGRRPRLPREWALSDLVIVGTGLFVAYAGIHPLRHRSALARLVFGATSEDRSAHFAFFDTIHRLGSYPMLDQAAARVSLQTPAEATYPTGSHLIYAVIDIFARSTGDPGPAIAEFNRYVLLVIGGYAFFVMATVWAGRWILTPLVRDWRLLAATSGIAAVLVGGPLMGLVTAGFDSQILGTAFVGLAAAVAIRPPAGIGERITLFGSLTILVAYTYYLYLPLAVIAVLASFLVHKRFLRRHWRTLLLSAIVVGAISVVPLYFAATSSLDIGAQALIGGATMRIPRSVIVAVTVSGLAVLITPAARRQPRVRIAALLIGALLAVTLLFGTYQRLRLGTTSYYYEKLWVCYFVVALVCSSMLVTFLAPRVTASPAARHPLLREAVVGAVATTLAFTAIAGFGVGRKIANPATGSWGQTSLGMWFVGKQVRSDATEADLKELGARGLLADGTPTLFLVSNSAYENWRLSFINGALNRINGTMKTSVNMLLHVPVGGKPVDRETLDRALGEVAEAVAASGVPLRIVTRDPQTATSIQELAATRPDLRVTVLLLSGG